MNFTNFSPFRSVRGWSRSQRANWVSKTIALSVGVLAMVFFIAFIVWAQWTEPGLAPPGGNVLAPVNVSSTPQTKAGPLTVTTLTTSGAKLYLDDITQGDIERVNAVIGYDDLFLRSNPTENAPVYIAGSQVSFWSGATERWRIDSTGSLALGFVPWARLTSFPAACPAGQYATAVGSTLTCSTPAGGVTACSDCDPRFVNVTGDTMTEYLTIDTPNNDKIVLRGTQVDPHTIWLGNDKGARFWDSVNGELMRITNTGDISWLGSLTSGSVPWARLTSFPADCPAGQYAYGAGGTLKCSTPAGGIGGGGTATQIAFFTDAANIGSDGNLYWDNINKRLGIGTITPTYQLDVVGNIGLDQYLYHNNDPNTYLSFAPYGVDDSINIVVGGLEYLWFSEGGTDKLVGNANNADIDFQWDGDTIDNLFKIDAGNGEVYINGNVGIGATIPTEKLQVGGNIKLGGTEGDVKDVNAIIGYDDLHLRSDAGDNAALFLEDFPQRASFYFGGVERWRIDSTGSLALGFVPWARLTSFPAACPAGQYATAVGSTLTCSTPAGGGDITAVNAGTGLSGGGISGDVTLSADTTYLQRRVSGTCSAGSSIRVINADGTVTCETDDGGIANCSDCDPRFVNVTGDTMTEYLTIDTPNNDKIVLRGTQVDPHTIWLGNDKGARFWDSVNGELMRITNTGDISWLGSLTSGSVPWARLTSFPADCPAGQYAYGAGGTLKCSTPAGGIGGGGTDNYIPRWLGTTDLENSVIYQTDAGNVGIGTINPDLNYKLTTSGGGVKGENNNVAQPAGYFSNLAGGLALQTGTGDILLGGDLTVGGGTGKLTVGVIDPIFEIDGEKYATYVADFAGGIRTETSGVIRLERRRYLIDFDNLEKGSDLWLFWQTSNKDLSDVAVLLTSSFEGKSWYEKDGNALTIYGEKSGEVSYRLSAPRIDYQEWSNLAENQDLEGIIISKY